YDHQCFVGRVMLTLAQSSGRPAEAPPGLPSTPPPTPSLFPGQVAEVPVLQAQIRDLTVQLAGLQAQWDGLKSQLDNMLRNNPARPGVQQTWANVGVQIAQVKGDIAYREARIAQIEGRTTSTTAPPPPFPWLSRPLNPNLAIVMTMVMFVSLV